MRLPQPKLEHSPSALPSFTEYMRQRGKTASSRILRRGIFLPTPDEMMALGLSAAERVARVERLRFADDIPLALAWSSLPTDILPDPDAVETSLYDVLRGRGTAPTRAAADHGCQPDRGRREAAAAAGRRGGAADRPDRLPAFGPADRVHPRPLPQRHLRRHRRTEAGRILSPTFSARIAGRRSRCLIGTDPPLAAHSLCFSPMAAPAVVSGGRLVRRGAVLAEVALPDLVPGRPHEVALEHACSDHVPRNRA